ncbi:DNA-binding transcriptional ArsR family regulator [Bacillus sp. RC242]
MPSSFKITKTHLQIYKSRYNILMEPLLIYKALSNETRYQILSWLKNPENHFDEKPYLEQGLSFQIGVCVGDIQLKTGLAQSVISSYLLTMKKAGLLDSDRIGKWTYYRRNEKTIREFSEYVQNEL